MDEPVGVRPLDRSAGWVLALRGDGAARAEALARFRAHLAAAAKFELGRRGIAADDGQRGEASPVQVVVEAAVAAILADLDRFAIREAAAAARARGVPTRSSGGG